MKMKESQCIKIHPTGSELRFKLFPKKTGIYKVGANVNLFDSLDCSGIPVPKTTATLTVEVVVNEKELDQERFNALAKYSGPKYLSFGKYY